jgi:hypothetical protein
VVFTPTLATFGAEVRLILSMTEIAAWDLHCLPNWANVFKRETSEMKRQLATSAPMIV